MTVPFAVRVFVLSFAPLCALLIGSFWSIQYMVGEQVKNGLRNSLRQTHSFVSRVRANYELQNSRLLTVLAENPSLKAGFELVRLERNNRGAQRTLEDQLHELSESLGFDLMAAADTNDRLQAGVMRVRGQLAPHGPRPSAAAGRGRRFNRRLHLRARPHSGQPRARKPRQPVRRAGV